MGNEDLNFIPNKELDKEILIPIPRESKIGKDCDFPLEIDRVNSYKEEVHTENLKSHLNPLFKDDEEIISNEASRQISPKVDVKTIVSFFSQIGNCVRKWATSEVVKDNDEFNHEGKIFDPGITFHEEYFEKDAFNDKSSKELAPSKSLLILDVFDPLHPPLMNFHVTNGAVFNQEFSHLLEFLHHCKFSRILEDSWFNIGEDKAIPANVH
ncbi:hypothetical protein Tco_0080298 [Tanacetum coccineum]